MSTSSLTTAIKVVLVGIFALLTFLILQALIRLCVLIHGGSGSTISTDFVGIIDHFFQNGFVASCLLALLYLFGKKFFDQDQKAYQAYDCLDVSINLRDLPLAINHPC